VSTTLRFTSSSLFLLLALLFGAVSAQPRFNFATAPGNLSKDVVPIHYRLSLDLDPGKETFSGVATIAIRIASATPSFVIHAHELTADSAVLTAPNGQPRPLNVQPAKLPQAWQLSATDGLPLLAGEYVLRIQYRGKVQATGSGLFKVPYTARGKPSLRLATQPAAVGR
jgi:aminopeptidase N